MFMRCFMPLLYTFKEALSNVLDHFCRDFTAARNKPAKGPERLLRAAVQLYATGKLCVLLGKTACIVGNQFFFQNVLHVPHFT